MAENNKTPSVVKQELNTATVGLNLDQSINQIPKGSLTYALNALMENFDGNSVSYQNEPGNEKCLDFPEDYQLIAKHAIIEKNKHIFFLTNPLTGMSQIGYMDNNNCEYKILGTSECFGWDVNFPIHKIVHRITNCSTEIYWADNVARRYMDIENPPYKLSSLSSVCDPIYTDEIDCNKLNLQPNFSIPELKATDVMSGGELKAGTYQFAVQYSDVNGIGYSSYYSVTNPLPIANPQITSVNFDYVVGKSIEIEISNLDTRGQWQYFNLAVIKTINAISSVELVGTYFVDAETKKIIYTGQNSTNINLTINDIFEKYPYYEQAEDITSVQDILVWKGLTSIDRVNYQKIANGITLQWQSYRIPADETYADELNAANLRGYLRDEIYPFELVFLLNNGKQTDGFHIPARQANTSDLTPVPNTNADFIGEPDYYSGSVGYSPYWKIYNTAVIEGTSENYTTDINYKGEYQYGQFAYWESTERYPCNTDVWGELANKPIRHHKFPDVSISPIFESAIYSGPNMTMQKDAIFSLGVRIDTSQIVSLINSSDLTQAQKESIQGFKIVRGDRSGNKSIVAKGMLRNVGKYAREGTEYYYPNYPYNDLSTDPFLLTQSNAYTANAIEAGNAVCRNFSVTVTEITAPSPFIVEYIDCYTNTLVTKQATSVGETLNFCCLDFPAPRIISGKGCFECHTYKIYEIIPVGPFSADFNIYFPTINALGTCGDPSPYSSVCDYCVNQTAPNDCCTQPPNKTLRGVTGATRVNSLVIPEWVPGGDENYTITEVGAVGYDICVPKNLDGFTTDDSKYRHVFNSPETSFGQPFLGNVLKIENVIYGAGKAHFVQVKKNALYKLISKEAQQDALVSAEAIATIGTFDATVLFAAYQAYLTIYTNGITRRNYAYSFNSIASYDYSAQVDNNIISTSGFTGIKQRPIEIAQYLIPGVQNVGDNFNINNYQRESSVYIKTSDENKLLSQTYTTYRICNNNFVVSTQVFSYTDPVLGVQTISIPFNTCSDVNSFTYPTLTSGNTTYTVYLLGTSSINTLLDTPPLLFPNESPSIAALGLEEDSRYVVSEKDCTKPEQEDDINVISYYASLKNIFINQWGQIYSYDTIDTGYQRDIVPYNAPIYETIFGGDTFISKFAFKTKIPFFIDNRVGAPDDSDIYYDELGNVAYPKYWFSSRSVLSDVVVNGVTMTNFLSAKAHNFDCPNSQTPVTTTGRTYYDGKMYLFAYGIPYFYCESSYNVDLRQAFNNKEGDFFPHVSTGIPDDWVQESFVSIANDNTYYYNTTYSKQNKENFFSHLPIDWSQDLCLTYFPFRAIYSDVQNTDVNSRVNNWLIYRPTSSFDFPQNYGKLISLDGIQNKAVLARFENKSLLYNTMLTINTSNPQAAYIGNDTLFKSAPPIDFAETDLGYVGTQNKFLLKIPQGQISVDAKRGQIFLITGNGAIDISAAGSGLHMWFTEHLPFEILKTYPEINIDNNYTSVGLHGVYDSKYDRVIITKLDYAPKVDGIEFDLIDNKFYIDKVIGTSTIRTEVYLQDDEYFCNKGWTLSYNLNTKTWTSFHSYIPNWYIAENNFFYSGINNCCSTIDAIVATVLPEPSTTTTTSSSTTTTSSSSTTSTTTTIYTGCDLEGTASNIDCNLYGEAEEITTTTTTTTATPTTTTTTTGEPTTTTTSTSSTTTTTTTIEPTTTTTTSSSSTTTTTTTEPPEPTTTTTTTTQYPCICYRWENPTGGALDITYTVCEGVEATVSIPSLGVVTDCVQSGTTITVDPGIVWGICGGVAQPCLTEGDCSACTSPTTTTTTTTNLG